MLAPWIIGYVIIGVACFSVIYIKGKKAMKTVDEYREYEPDIPAHIILFITIIIFWPALIFFGHSIIQALRKREERKGKR